MLNKGRLKHLRLLHDLTQTELANELNITRNYISMVESRKRTYSQEWYDNYVNTIYKLSIEKKKAESEPAIGILKEIPKEIVEKIVEVTKETPKVAPKIVKQTATKTVAKRKTARKTVTKKTIK